ncbi:MAG: FGGY-family carbohydrate kinase [Rubrivivax sp.]
MTCVVGLDIGTTSTIGLLLRLPDEPLALAHRAVTLHHPHAGWAEEDPQQWWDNVCGIVAELLHKAGVSADQVRAVGVAGMVPALVLLDAQSRLLRPSIQQSDGRCGQEVLDLREEISEPDFVRRTGNGINQQLLACKLRWIERHEPQVFERIGCAFGSYDYINWRLTGVKRVEQNWALEAGFIELASGAIDEGLVGLGGLFADQVPPLAASQEVIGTVTAAAAAATGLRAGTPVVAGVADHIASAWAAGVQRPGDMLVKLGGACDILLSSERARPDPRLFLDYHAIPGLYMPNGCMACSGSLLNWFAGHFGHAADARPGGGHRLQKLDAWAAEVPAGSLGVRALPYFLGEKTPVQDPLARGAFSGLGLHHGPPHLWRSLLEAVAFGVRHHREVFCDLGYPCQRVLASDGGSASRVWLQIIADVLGQPVTPLTGHPGSCLGAAWMAAMGTGLASDWNGAATLVRLGTTVEPTPAHAELYDEAYADYRRLYTVLAPMFHREGGGR